MIVRDEADGIGHVVEQAREFADEVVVLDTGSTDDTVSIAAAAGADVSEAPWPGSFAKARNAAQDLTSGGWVMHLDGHDHLPEQTVTGLRDELKPILDGLHADAVVMPMVIVSPEGEPLLSYPRERVTRRHLRWQGDAHTILNPTKPVHRPYPVHTLQRMGNKPRRALGVLQAQYEAGDRKPRTVFYLARETFWSGRYADAVPLYDEWLAMLPVRWEAYSGLLDLAACHELCGRPAEAQETRWRAAALIPTRAEAWAALGLEARQSGRFDAAEVYFRNCVQSVRPIDGFVVERWYGELPKRMLREVQDVLAGSG